jgi:sialidase-1
VKSRPNTELSVVKSRAKILQQRVLCRQPGRYIGWPTIALAANGDLLVVFSGDRAKHVSPDGKTQLVRSRDGGKTWDEAVTINDLEIDDRDAGIVRTQSGALVVSWFTGPPYHTKIQGHYTIRSTDHGRTWGAPVRTQVTTPHGPIQLRDGRLLCIGLRPHCSHTTPSTYNGPPSGSPHKVSIEESRDDGLSWQFVADFPVPPKAQMLSFDEPHAVETAGGTIVAQFRDCNPTHRLWQSESMDGGRTWSAPRQTKLHGYPPHLLLLRNGWLLSTYGKRWEPFGEYACISRDGGETWAVDEEIALSPAPNSDLGYPASVQLDDGTIWTVYYQVRQHGEKPCLMGTHWQLPTE